MLQGTDQPGCPALVTCVLAVDGSSQNRSDPCLEGKRAPEQTKMAEGRINTLLEAENIWGSICLPFEPP